MVSIKHGIKSPINCFQAAGKSGIGSPGCETATVMGTVKLGETIKKNTAEASIKRGKGPDFQRPSVLWRGGGIPPTRNDLARLKKIGEHKGVVGRNGEKSRY